MVDSRQAKILVIDDEEANLALIRALLRKGGYTEVECTTDSRQAVQLTTSFEPDLIMLDLHMPMVDGYTVLDQLDALVNGPLRVPIMVLTADMTDEARERALALGARDFVSKPFKVGELLVRINNLVESRLSEVGLARELASVRTELRQATEDDGGAAYRAMHQRIERALHDRTMTIEYQPIVDVRANRIAGFEALARFPTPPVEPPDVWFAHAHEVGLGVPLELMAVEGALAGSVGLDPDAFVSINISEWCLRAPQLLELLSSHQPEHLVLELLESVPISDLTALVHAVADARALGTRVAVDGVGSGQAGLKQLLAIRPDFIKLDRSLIAGIGGDRGRRSLIAGLLTFAAEIGATLVTEGVESAEEYVALTELGVELAQGYYIGRAAEASSGPVPLDHLRSAAHGGPAASGHLP